VIHLPSKRIGFSSAFRTLTLVASMIFFIPTCSVVEAAVSGSPTVEPNPRNFPTQYFALSASSVTRTVTVSNPPSGATIKFKNINPTQPDFVVTGGTCQINGTLSPGDSCSILITFKPIQLGHRQASLFVEWGSVQVRVHLSGYAIAPPLAISPKKLNFGSQPVGTTSPTSQTITLSNNSPVTIGISGTALLGSYVVNATSCLGALNSGAQCNLTVSTMPICPGKSSGTLRIIDDASNSPQAIALSVTGIAGVVGPSEAVLLAGGLTTTVSGIKPTNTAELFNSNTCSNTSVHNMTRPRAFQTQTYLDPAIVFAEAGEVLITGGQIDAKGTITNTAELFDPATGRFTATHVPMTDPRMQHTATLLSEGPLAGTVLIVGGITTGSIADGTTELYDPSSDTFTPSGSLTDARGAHAAAPIVGCGASCAQEGDVIVAGGHDTSGEALNTAEVFNTATQTFSCIRGVNLITGHCKASLSSARDDAQAVLLPSGKIVFIGGNSANAKTFPGTPVRGIDAYLPAISTMTAGPTMSEGRDLAAMALFPAGPFAGEVLVTGGADLPGASTNTAELYDPAHNVFTCVQGVSALTPICNRSIAHRRAAHTAASFDAGPMADMVLVAGGIDLPTQNILNSVEVFNPITGTFQSVPGMQTPRSDFTATVIPLP
jgi:hypothetical protein